MSQPHQPSLVTFVLFLLPILGITTLVYFGTRPFPPPAPATSPQTASDWTQTAVSDLSHPLRLQRLDGQPISQLVSELHPYNQHVLEDFSATVPETLPELAYPSSVLLRPDISREEDSRLVMERINGSISFTVSVVNPGTNHNQPNILCVRNQTQVPCTPDVDVWEAWLPPLTMTIVPISVSMDPGDQITILLIPPDESKRVFPASQMVFGFADQVPSPPDSFVTLPPAQKPVFHNCDHNILLPSVSQADSYRLPTYYFLSKRVPLEFLIKICEPKNPFYVYLVTIVNRIRLVKLPDPVWHHPAELAQEAMIVPINTDLFGGIKTMQIAIIPHGSTQDAFSLRPFRYSFEVVFPPER